MKTLDRTIAHDANYSIKEVLSRQGFGRRLLLVCDDDTWKAAGEAIKAQLQTSYEVIGHSLGRTPHPTLSRCEEIIAAGREVDGLISVGSGTINDITKYAATQLGKSYISVATAASMNGYTSASASLIANGFKRAYAAKPPVAVIADLSVICAAPKRLARAGYGDTLCRSTVEADMLLAHLLLGSPYPREIFDFLRRHEPTLIENAKALYDQEDIIITALMEALLDGGDAMTEFGSSAVASQGEHMIAHTIEMIYGSEVLHVPHGEIIAVTSITMGNLQQRIMLGGVQVKTVIRQEATFLRLFGKQRGPLLMESYRQKVLSNDQVIDINARLNSEWDNIKKQLNEILLSPKTIERAFMVAHVPTKPSDIRVDEERYKTAAANAHMTRERFTFLDLAAMNDRTVF